MSEFSSSLKLNQIYMVDSPFNEDHKKYNFSFQGGHNFGRETAGKFRENGQITGTFIAMQIGG